MIFEFFRPLSEDFIAFKDNLPHQALGTQIVCHTEEEFPKFEDVQIALIGVLDNRGGGDDSATFDLTAVRKAFYQLFPGNWNMSIIDLGDILPGEDQADTYYVLKNANAALIKQGIVPLVLGGSQDLTYAMYRAYDQLEQMVNVVAVDSKFDLSREDKLSSDSYLTQMIIEEPNNLFNYCNIGFQTYFNSQDEIDLIDKLYFDAYRLGDISKNPTIAEPVFRDADLVSVDMTSVKSSASGNLENFNPNGFDGKEICTLSRYSGISDKVTSFGIFNQNGTRSEALLIAEILWYFIEGYSYRSFEFPYGDKSDYYRYIVPLEEEELIFYKSNKTGRWWIEIPITPVSESKMSRNALLPCTQEDYNAALQCEIPERWWKAQKKNLL